MNINPEKVQAAIRALRAAADELVYQRGNPGNIAGECIKTVAALESSLAIAGVPRVFKVIGETD